MTRTTEIAKTDTGVLKPLDLQEDLTPEMRDALKDAQAVAQTIGRNPPVEVKLENNVSLGAQSSTADKVQEVASVRINSFPNPMVAALHAGLKQEAVYQAQIRLHVKETKDIQDTINRMLDISGELSACAKGDKEEIALSDKLKDLIGKLKQEDKIEIMPDQETTVTRINRERYNELKSHISSHIDQLKTKVQNIFTTEIQVKISFLNSIMDCLKTIEKYSSRLNSTIIANSAKK